MCEDGNEDERLGVFVAYVDDWQINISNGETLPERFKIVDIFVKVRVVDPGVVMGVQMMTCLKEKTSYPALHGFTSRCGNWLE